MWGWSKLQSPLPSKPPVSISAALVLRADHALLSLPLTLLLIAVGVRDSLDSDKISYLLYSLEGAPGLE